MKNETLVSALIEATRRERQQYYRALRLERLPKSGGRYFRTSRQLERFTDAVLARMQD